MASLEEENKQLREQVRLLTERQSSLRKIEQEQKQEQKQSKEELEFSQELETVRSCALSVVVVGASGHLARTKTFPALFQLFKQKLLPHHVSVVGYARSKFSDDDFRGQISKSLKGDDAVKKEFLQRCSYHAGDYEHEEAFASLHKYLLEQEKSSGKGDAGANRIFYFAIPPSVFGTVAVGLKKAAMSPNGWNRMIVEKPFGRDTESSRKLSEILLGQFKEKQLYRIDHYLGKEMVQNLMVLRFANIAFLPLWHHHYIKNVQITFKEDVGVEGRGGYFDEFGIIRDVMQNHLMQILALVAMEQPVSQSAEDIRDEKVKVLRCIRPLELKDIIVGQYTGDEEKKVPGYTEDPTVPKGSISPTFAIAHLRIHNDRWHGVPFILKCGKGLSERKAEIRIQFKNAPGGLYPNLAANELVIRVQPKEAIYLKLITKSPGLSESVEQSELDLSYTTRFVGGAALPDAYERLILDVLRGDHRLFVRGDELEYAWKIFTPVLHQLEKEQVKPLPYKFGTRGPAEADEMAKKLGFVRTEGYQWTPPKLAPVGKL